MIRNLGTLHHLVVRQNDVAVAKIVAARQVQHALGSRRHNRNPLQILSRAYVLGLDLADKSVGVGDLLHDGVRRHRDDARFRRGSLKGCQRRLIGIYGENLLCLRAQSACAQAKRSKKSVHCGSPKKVNRYQSTPVPERTAPEHDNGSRIGGVQL